MGVSRVVPVDMSRDWPETWTVTFVGKSRNIHTYTGIWSLQRVWYGTISSKNTFTWKISNPANWKIRSIVRLLALSCSELLGGLPGGPPWTGLQSAGLPWTAYPQAIVRREDNFCLEGRNLFHVKVIQKHTYWYRGSTGAVCQVEQSSGKVGDISTVLGGLDL